MGLFNQMKMAQNMMKDMSPGEIKDLMKQAQESKNQMEDMIRKIVAEEIDKRNLVSRDELHQ
jgi:BMFP domain-containing protein YqiC